MKFKIQELEVFFPFDMVFQEQYEYMTQLKNNLDHSGHCIIECPTGTGKTISLLALITSYIVAYPDRLKKLVYCTRTVVEMEKTIKEVEFLLKCRKLNYPDEKFEFLTVGLSARRNLCIHPEVSKSEQRDKVDAECRKRTAEWVRGNKGIKDIEDLSLCEYYENLNEQEDLQITSGIFNLDDLKEYGKEKTYCPYFLSKKIIQTANIVVYNYLYMIDPNIKDNIPSELRKNSVVVFDEAHNIDNVCLEAFSVDLNKRLLDQATSNTDKLSSKVNLLQTENIEKLENEYQTIVQNLQQAGKITQNQAQSNINEIPQDLQEDAIPFQVKKTKPFMNNLKKILIFLKNKLKEKNLVAQDPHIFMNDLYISMKIDQKFLQMTSERLAQLMNSLRIAETDEYKAITTIARFCSLIATYSKGFKIIQLPNPFDGSLNDPILTISCMDCSLAMQPVFKEYRSVVLTSGTMSPLEIYPKILDFQPYLVKSIEIELSRNAISPMIITKGLDYSPLTSEYDQRSNREITRSYGRLLIELSQFIPDGIVCFFPSYSYMEKVVREWNEDKILDEIRKFKLPYFETKDVAQTSKSLDHFRRACDCGRGAIFLSIARGKVAEGIDFNQQYGRCVIMIGFPVQNSHDPILIERCKFLMENYNM